MLTLPQVTSINDDQLDVEDDFLYLGPTISDALSFERELNKNIGKAVSTMTRLTKKTYINIKLIEHAPIQIYRASVVSIVLYGSESRHVHSRQE